MTWKRKVGTYSWQFCERDRFGMVTKKQVTRNQMANRDLQRGDKTGHGWNHLAMDRYTHRVIFVGAPINGRKSIG